MTTNEQRHRARLRQVAEHHNLELAGISTILMPKSAARLAVLREAWLSVADEAAAGTLTGPLAFCNFGAGGVGWKPWAWHEWSER